MIKTLVKHGNSLALIIDKPILELLKIKEDTPLEITTDGVSLALKPAPRAIDDDTFERSLQKANKRYGRALKKLAE